MSSVFSFDDFDASSTRNTSSDEVILDLLKSWGNLPQISTLDIGCGQGNFADRLANLGYQSFGVEPQATVPEYTTAKGALIFRASGESLPFEKDKFDLVMFGHSLHHVPVEKIGAALREALRVLKPNGHLLVAEPLSVGPFYKVIQPVDDEAPLYRAVEHEIESLVSFVQIKHIKRTYTQANPSYDTFDELKEVITRVAPERLNATSKAWDELHQRFLAQPISETNGKRHLLNFSRVDQFTQP